MACDVPTRVRERTALYCVCMYVCSVVVCTCAVCGGGAIPFVSVWQGHGGRAGGSGSGSVSAGAVVAAGGAPSRSARTAPVPLPSDGPSAPARAAHQCPHCNYATVMVALLHSHMASWHGK